MTTQAAAETPTHYVIDGFRIPVITPEPRHDVRFMSQRQLWDMGTVGAHVELRRRAGIVARMAAS